MTDGAISWVCPPNYLQEVSDESIDALVLSGDDQAIMKGLRQRLEWADELVIGVGLGEDLPTAEDNVLRLLSKL